MGLIVMVSQAVYSGDFETENYFADSEERFVDFYARFIESDRRDKVRNRGANEAKEYRKSLVDQYEEARKDFVKERRDKPEPDESEYQKELALRQKEHETARKEFVLQQEQKKRIESQGLKIPDEHEYRFRLESSTK